MSNLKINTKDQIVEMIRKGEKTANELADALHLSTSAIRMHLLNLENEGLILRDSKRISGAGQPTIVFKLAADKEDAFSFAYKPVLVELLDTLPDTLSEEELVKVMQEVGHKLALKQPQFTGTLQSKVEKASEVLTSLGALIELDKKNDGIKLTSYSCPLADAVRCRPEVCHAVTAFLETTTSTKVIENCKRELTPLICEFMILNSI